VRDLRSGRLAVPTAHASLAEMVATPLNWPSSESWGLGRHRMGTGTAFQDLPLKLVRGVCPGARTLASAERPASDCPRVVAG